jgi:aminoglycoside phosphotransferase (APT) family kinase protein
MPAAEVEIGPELVRRLLRAQHPDLAGLALEVLASGWDNVIVRAGEELVVRLPRRTLGAELIAHEQRWLPVLAPRLPLPVPVPVRIGAPGCGYPWAWSVCAYLPGQVAALAAPEPHRAAGDLARFLAALHTPAPDDAPRNAFRGIPLAGRIPSFADSLARLGDLLDIQAVTERWEAALAAPVWPGPPVWLHGDLHPANLLVDAGRLSGVIDFGDVTSGDPATDLAVIWMLLPRAAHDRFWTAYAGAAQHEVNDALRRRTQGWALALGVVFVAHSADNPRMAAIGRRTLDALLE